MVVAHDILFNYTKMMKATSYIFRGAAFYAANDEAHFKANGYARPGKVYFITIV